MLFSSYFCYVQSAALNLCFYCGSFKSLAKVYLAYTDDHEYANALPMPQPLCCHADPGLLPGLQIIQINHLLIVLHASVTAPRQSILIHLWYKR